MIRRLVLPLAAAILAAAGTWAVCTTPVRLDSGSPLFARAVRGAPDGVLRQLAVVVLPGLERSRPRRLFLVRVDGSGDAVSVRVDGGLAQWARLPRAGLVLEVPAAAVPGLRLDLEGDATAPPPRIAAIVIEGGARAPLAPASFAFAATLATVLVLRRRLAPGVAEAVGLGLATVLAVSYTPALLWLSLPGTGAIARLGLAILPAAGSVLLARSAPENRRAIACGVALAASFVFGAWVRGYFLPSAGSWDTDYWKSRMARAASHGITGVYGDPDSVPPGHFLAQLSGREPQWEIPWGGRTFVVDYPPLAIALWHWSDVSVRALLRGLDPAEARNVAAKLPAVLGDLAAVPLLLWAWRRRPDSGVWLAAAYWALPVSWWSSAVLGYLDGACAPLLLAAVLAAGAGRSLAAGLLLALACLVKPTAAIAAPALVVALLAARASLRRAVLAGLAVVVAALVPFLLAGTLPAAVVHVYRILFQERLSGGFANPWWLLGHALTLGPDGWRGAVQYAKTELLAGPVPTIGLVAFLLCAAAVVRRQRGQPGPGPALLASSALLFGYGMLAIGVHVNHPHPLFLLLLAAGLRTRLELLWAAAGVSYVTNMALLEGLGRFYGQRHAAIEPLAQWITGLRLALGFDATLLLVAVNLAVFGGVLASLSGEPTRRGRA